MNPEAEHDHHDTTPELQRARADAASRTTWVSVAVNLALSVGQIVVGVLSRSQGLIADGAHSASDLIADGVVLFAGHHSRKAAYEDHPYGHQRFETAATFILGLLLLLVGLGMVSTAVRRIADPAEIPTVSVIALYVAGVALLAKELLFRYMLVIAKRLRSTMLVANAWHARSDAASSFVVALGIIGNLAGLPILDPVAALIVGLMISKMGWSFGWEAMSDLMDRAVDPGEIDAIRERVAATPGVLGVHNLRTRKMGDMIVVDVHLEVDADITVEAGHAIAVAAETRIREHHRVLSVMTHVDPAHRPDADHAHPASAAR